MQILNKTGAGIRLPGNEVLQRKIELLLTRPVGRPSNAPVVWYADFFYQAQSWDHARRAVAKVEWHKGELFPRVGFILTNLGRPAKGVVWFYNGRRMAEQWIKEGKNAFQMAEVAVPRALFRAILKAIERLRLATAATG